MPDRDDLRMFLGVGAVVVTLGVGTCSTNSRLDDLNRRIDEGFENLNRRMDEGFENLNRRMDEGFENLNRRMDDTNRRIDDL